MMQDAVTRFLELLARDPKEDEACQSVCKAAESRQDALAAMVAYAAERGFLFQAEELSRRLTTLPRDLGDDELEGVAGGGLVIEDRAPPLKTKTAESLKRLLGPKVGSGQPQGGG